MAFSEIFNGSLLLISIAFISASLLLLSARRWQENTSDIILKVNKLLPQTQCAQCGYPGCRPFAAAVVEGQAAINLCPPGGEDTVRRLAELLGREVLPLAESVTPAVAVIDEALCIGCTHCRNACPVDAIVGAHQLMHTVIESECTGCELCVAPCPVDCISMRPLA